MGGAAGRHAPAVGRHGSAAGAARPGDWGAVADSRSAMNVSVGTRSSAASHAPVSVGEPSASVAALSCGDGARGAARGAARGGAASRTPGRLNTSGSNSVGSSAAVLPAVTTDMRAAGAQTGTHSAGDEPGRLAAGLAVSGSALRRARRPSPPRGTSLGPCDGDARWGRSGGEGRGDWGEGGCGASTASACIAIVAASTVGTYPDRVAVCV